MTMRDRINLVYSDAPFRFDENLTSISRYADRIREAAHMALEKEAILVTVVRVYHSE
jgi:hypothetical protein